MRQLPADKRLAPEDSYDGLSELDELILDTWLDMRAHIELSYPWGQGKFPKDDGPDTWQIEAAEIVSDYRRQAESARVRGVEIPPLRLSVSSGHGIGKDTFVAWLIRWAMDTMPGLNCNVTANTLAQLMTKTWRELSIWHNLALTKSRFELSATKYARATRAKDWFTAALPWSMDNTDAFQGLHGEYAMVIYSEASGIPDPIWDVTDGALTTPGAMHIVVGNMTRSTGRFRETMPDGARAARWKSLCVDSRTCKMTNKTYLNQLVEDHGEDSDYVRVRVRGLPPMKGTDEFIGTDVVAGAQQRIITPEHWGHAPRVIGADVARKGSNGTVLITRKGIKAFKPIRYFGLNTQKNGEKIIMAIEEAPADDPVVAVFLDFDGYGAAVYDELERRGYSSFIIPVKGGDEAYEKDVYYNKRAECYGRLKTWLDIGSLPADDQLGREIVQIRLADRQPDKRGAEDDRILLEKKKAMIARGLGSPDSADALAYTFAEPISGRRVQHRNTQMLRGAREFVHAEAGY